MQKAVRVEFFGHSCTLLYSVAKFDLGAAQTAIWIGTAGLEVLVLIMATRRRLYGIVPWFYAYLVIESVRDVVIAPLAISSTPTYFYAYWVGEGVAGASGLFVIYEIYRQVLMQYACIKRLAFLIFGWATLVLVVVTAVTAFAAGGTENVRIVATFLAFDRSVRLVQAGLLLLLLIFSKALHLSWRHYVAGISLGFAVYITTDLVAATLRAHLGRGDDPVYVLMKPLAYGVAVLIWFAYVAGPFRRYIASVPDSRELNELWRWNTALEGLLE
jgi:hypothetical protein